MDAQTHISGTLTYVVARKLSSGGMGEIYEALQLGVNGFRKRVALKLLHPRLAQDEALLSNFIGEAKLVADLIHTNIGQIYNLGHHEGRFFIVMELIDGVSLAQLAQQELDVGGAPPFELCVFIASRVARGLAYAHEKHDEAGASLGLVHRDVNPENVMLSFEGDVKLMDFGVAKANLHMSDREEEVIAGKLDYMSPEQIGFRRTDFRSDQFSLCVILVELLLGRRLFRGATIARTRALIEGFRADRVFTERPEVFADPRLREILLRGLESDPEARYETTRALLVDMERLIYSTGYGPTNETLAAYLKGLFPRGVAAGLTHVSPTVIVE